MVKKIESRKNLLEKFAVQITKRIGTPYSLLIHTFLFSGIFLLVPLGFGLDQVMLFLTTAVSLEAIYLSILIQMSVNKNTESLESVEEDIEDIQEDVEGLEDEVEEISEDISEEEQARLALTHLEKELKNMQTDLDFLKKKRHITTN